ncbi:PAS domain-containing sensor histidine kinase [Parvularcula dongshanensis]|uniref:histidine kinase n=1 Tax=Parvularcula dongshanensis TaxID=1173995 RepID=A0A840I2V9_9PROT|nr:ATP-binding protein [Parvularcula dongshanensis]MBB4658554.1 two-component system cell cycle sensor histidine kinase PleC [Parvularcula dongshanensis]
MGKPDARRQPGERVLPTPRRVTALTLLVLGVCLGVLTMRAVIDTRAARSAPLADVQLAAVEAADRLAAAPPITPGAAPPRTAKAMLSTAAGPGGMAFLLDDEGRPLLFGGTPARFDVDPSGLTRIEGWARVGDERVRVARRPVAGGQEVVVLRPGGPAAFPPVWLPHALAALALTLLTGALLAALRGYAEQATRDAREKALLLKRLMGPERAGCGIWRADGESIELPGALIAKLGGPRADVRVRKSDVREAFHERDSSRALLLTSGSEELNDLRCRVRYGSGDWQYVYMSVLTRTPEVTEGIVVPVSERGLDDGRSSQLIQRLRETLEAIPQAFLLWDAYGRLVAWNDEFRIIFEVKAGDMREGMDAEALAEVCSIDARYLHDYFAPPSEASVQTEATFPDDRVLRITRRRTLGDGWVCIGTDVTDAKADAEAKAIRERELRATVAVLKKSRRELSEAMESYQLEKARAEEANRSKSEFLANMSHELRTPLNAIIGFSEMMEAEFYGPLGHDKYDDYVREVNKSGRHLLALIDDILDLSKIEAGKLELNFTQIDLERLLHEALRLIEPQARAADIHLRAFATDPVPSVWGDSRAIKQVLINLLSNAEKFTPQGGSVTVMTKIDLDTVTVMIADTGVGIPPTQIERLGAPFELLEDHFATKRRGSGLGLALSKSLIEAQSGILAIASEVGRGTVVSFVLPRRPGAPVRLPSILKGGSTHVMTKTPDARNGSAAHNEKPRAYAAS